VGMIVHLKDAAFTAPGLPTLYRDELIAPGTLFLFDIKDRFGFPKQAAGIVGDALKNLVETSPDAALTGSMAFDAKGGLTTTAGFTQYINAGQTYGAGFKDGTPKALFLMWLRIAADASQSYSMAGGLANSTANGSAFLAIDLGADHHSPRASGGSSTNAGTAVMSGGALASGVLAQLGASIEPEGGGYRVRAWRDGVVAGSWLVTGAAPPDLSATPFKIGGGFGMFKGTVYRALLEDMNASGRSFADVVAADYAANAARFA
jgi:hypothetical protein